MFRIIILVFLTFNIFNTASAEESFEIPCLDEMNDIANEFMSSSNNEINLVIKLDNQDKAYNGLKEMKLSWKASEENYMGVTVTLIMVSAEGQCILN